MIHVLIDIGIYTNRYYVYCVRDSGGRKPCLESEMWGVRSAVESVCVCLCDTYKERLVMC